MTRADMGNDMGLLALGQIWIPLGTILIAIGPSSITVADALTGDHRW